MTNHQSISFEFFPPRNADAEKRLVRVCSKLSAASPDYFSVTYGAGGSTKEGTLNTVKSIISAKQAVAPHLSFTGSDQQDMQSLLTNYQTMGIKRLVALRGDRPSGLGSYRDQMIYASELVTFIRQHFANHFHVSVAAYPELHPESVSLEKELAYFQRKVEAGADQAITQYFYNIDAYFSFIECCQARGINIPIVPGIMPITNLERLSRFSKMCGAEIPRWLYRRLENYQDDSKSLKAFGLEFVTQLCQRLLDAGAPGLHFYTLNQSEPSLSIVKGLNIKTA